MEYVIGVVLALVVTSGSTLVGFDRERVFYPVMMLVVASYYILFAAIGAPLNILVIETLLALAFMLLATVSFRTSLWIAVAALALHGGFDLVHDLLIDNQGVPPTWPGFCMAFDVVAAGYLAVLLRRRPRLVHQAGPA